MQLEATQALCSIHSLARPAKDMTTSILHPPSTSILLPSHFLIFLPNFFPLSSPLRLPPSPATFLSAASQVHPKNWYPIPLIFCKPWGILPHDMPCHPKLADFANCMKKKGRGMTLFVTVVEGEFR